MTCETASTPDDRRRSQVRAYGVILVMAGTLLLFGCADGDGNDGAVAADNSSTDEREEASETEPGSETAARPAVDEGSINDPPPPGTARLEAGGEVVSGDLRSCELTDTSFRVDARAELDDDYTYNFGGNGARSGSNWVAQAAASEAGTQPGYFSANGHVTVSGSTVMYAGQFTRIHEGDRQEVGEGRMVATCG